MAKLAHYKLIFITSIALIWTSPILAKTDAIEKKQTNAILSPELELAAAFADLQNLKLSLDSSEKLYQVQSFGPRKFAATQSIENGIKFFHQKEYLSAIREFQRYLNLSQIPAGDNYLIANDKIAQSYEKVGQYRKAIKHYLFNISSSITQEKVDFKKITEVLRRLLSLAAKFNNIEQDEVSKLLAAIASLKVPAKYKPEILLFAGKTAHKRGNSKAAANWYNQSSQTGNLKIKSSALYFKALIEVAAKNWERASELLNEIISIENTGNNETKDLSKLALARISLHLKKPKTALRYYQAIKKGSPQYKESLFEQIYLQLELDQAQESIKSANQFLKLYPNGSEAYQIRTLKAYLDLKSGDLESAKNEVSTANTFLSDLDKWLTSHYKNNRVMTQKDLTSIVNKTNLQLSPSPLLEEGLKQFKQISSLNHDLAQIKGDIRNLILITGRSTALDLNKKWLHRSQQIKNFSEKALEIGHRLIATEKYLYYNELSPVEKQTLEASENRRIRLLSQNAQLRRSKRQWASLGNLIGLAQSLSRKLYDLNKSEAMIATSRFLLKDKDPLDTNRVRIESLYKKTLQHKEALLKALEVLRMARISDIIQQSPHHAVAKTLKQYTLSLDTESRLFDNIREHKKLPSEKMLATDAQKAWKQWRFLVKEIYHQLADFDKEIKIGITNLLDTFDTHEKDYADLTAQLSNLKKELQLTLGSSASMILKHYKTNLSSRLSRQRKWAADIDWIEYDKAKKKRIQSDEKFKLEQQILNDNLEDLQQGVLAKWPN